ncbi:MAG: 3-oxoacyl-[acyl-carrier-protein] reductase [Chloroflexi bacterium RBG_16_48_8]|nr:MAG: 3-oxoacyl-[acyl-carrier-protein] reductase [Chloroflexi bacterium RBG_16_48_8]
MPLEGKVAVVTGSSRGIGRSIALELGQNGASVVINYNQNEEAAKEVAAKIISTGSKAKIFKADVSKFNEAQDLIQYAIKEFEDLHILVNNAGTTRDGLIMTMSERDWDFVIETNLKSTFNCSRAAVRHMLRRRYGRIITITSVSGQMGNAGQTNYSASKAGQIGFTKALAREVASRNITVNAVAPGFIETDLTGSLPEDLKAELTDLIPLGRVGKPEEIAKAVAYLASDDAAYMTGHVLTLDGGMAMF